MVAGNINKTLETSGGIRVAQILVIASFLKWEMERFLRNLVELLENVFAVVSLLFRHLTCWQNRTLKQ